MAATEYLHTYLLTFNCGRELINPTALAPHFFDGLQHGSVKPTATKLGSNASGLPTQLPDLIVLNLQEIAPIAYSFLGGSFIAPYFNNFRTLVDLAVHENIAESGEDEPQPRYVNILARNIGLTAIMVFVRAELVSQIDGIMTAEVGVGVQETGHKGAVGVRLTWTIGDTTSSSISNEEGDVSTTSITFISAHLAPMEDKLERRNQDYKDIVKGLVFRSDITSQIAKLKSETTGADESSESAPLLSNASRSSSTSFSIRNGMYAPNSFLFFAGDLNYRTSIHPPSIAEVPSFPKINVDSTDKRHYLRLLEKDQLNAARAKGDVLQGFTEEKIHFPPTYKYNYHPANTKQQIIEDNDTESWEWASHRWPSWCDRILYWQPGHENSSSSSSSSTTSQNDGIDALSKLQVKPQTYTALPMITTSDHRPVALSVLIPLVPIPTNVGKTFEDKAPASLNMDWEAKRDAARRREIMVGIFSYLTLTREGNALLVGSIAAIVGGWLISKSWGH